MATGESAWSGCSESVQTAAASSRPAITAMRRPGVRAPSSTTSRIASAAAIQNERRNDRVSASTSSGRLTSTHPGGRARSMNAATTARMPSNISQFAVGS